MNGFKFSWTLHGARCRILVNWNCFDPSWLILDMLFPSEWTKHDFFLNHLVSVSTTNLVNSQVATTWPIMLKNISGRSQSKHLNLKILDNFSLIKVLFYASRGQHFTKTLNQKVYKKTTGKMKKKVCFYCCGRRTRLDFFSWNIFHTVL